MGKVGDREVYESSEYDIADRIYVNILFFKNLLFKQKYSFCTLFIYILYFLWKLCITYTLRSIAICLQLTPSHYFKISLKD